MRKFFISALGVAITAFLSLQVHGQTWDMGVIGTMVAVERVVASDCDAADDDGRCAFVAIEDASGNLADYMEHFQCTFATTKPVFRISPEYATMTMHDPGPVVKLEAKDMRCSIDPRTEFILVRLEDVAKECSRLSWKCNVIWLPDYDRTVALIGRIESKGIASD